MLMQDERPHGQVRRIDKVGVPTPLLVPSFSSCGFRRVAEIYGEMRDKLYGVCLVSASDLASGCIPVDVIDKVNVTVIDSGMYESRKQADECIVRGLPAANCPWSRDDYFAIAAGVDAAANGILVNYDGYEPLEQQIRRAAEDFSHAHNTANDFLVKPESPARLVNVARVAKHVDELTQFDIIGITAREAGDSLTQRCRTVVTLRDALDDANLNLPVHVFGAITPLEVLTYFFCGADVFDGLNWLRLAFRERGSIPIEETAFEEMKPNLHDFELFAEAWSANLSFLYRLQVSLQRYALTRDFGELAVEFPSVVRAARIAELAGAVISKSRE